MRNHWHRLKVSNHDDTCNISHITASKYIFLLFILILVQFQINYTFHDPKRDFYKSSPDFCLSLFNFRQCKNINLLYSLQANVPMSPWECHMKTVHIWLEIMHTPCEHCFIYLCVILYIFVPKLIMTPTLPCSNLRPHIKSYSCLKNVVVEFY